ncbi:MAG: class I SAM-dependent methyltransferase [Gemmataceae bacterium]
MDPSLSTNPLPAKEEASARGNFPGPHRTDSTPIESVQTGNRAWWTDNTMSYDWKDKIKPDRFSLPWFDEVDRRFIYGARLFATTTNPFDRIIPFSALSGKSVLEIGCGMGFHTELMVRAGARVTALDLSPTSLESCTARLRLKGLTAEVRQGDAEELPFPDKHFDFVWSWGVIHHSSRTAKIVREIARVLRPEGECRIMVYHREGMGSRIGFVKDHLLKGGFLRGSFDQTLHQGTDGFSARYYTKDQFEDLFRAFFREVSCEVCGQDADAVPLPRFLRRLALRLVPETWLRRRQARCGGFLFLRARQPF